MDISTIWQFASELTSLMLLSLLSYIFKWLINNLALIISLIALVLAIYSFYFINWRRGQIIVGSPSAYALCVQPEENGLTWVELPLSFYNDGASAQFIRNIRLILEQNDKKSNRLYLDAIYKALAWSKPSSNIDRDYEVAHQFTIEGRKAYSAVFAFGWRPGGIVLSVGRCKAKLEAKLNNDEGWTEILTFDLIIRPLTIKNLHTLRPYYNDPDISPEEFNNQELPHGIL